MSSQIVMTSKKTRMNYQEIIKINPKKRFGQPCIRETRISVYDVLSWLSNQMSIQEIIEDFPELTPNDIFACLSYTADKENK